MLSVSDRLLQLFAWRPRRGTSADRALAVIRDRFSPCPACGGSLQGHAIAKLASAFVGDDSPRDQELRSLISNHEWERASEYQDWNSERTMREYHLIRCAPKWQIVLTRTLSTPEMWAEHRLETTEVLHDLDHQTILGVIGDRWLTL